MTQKIETRNADITVLCTFRDDRDTIFYKYFAALPLGKPQVRSTVSFVDMAPPNRSIRCSPDDRDRRTETFVERCQKVAVKVRSTAILNQ